MIPSFLEISVSPQAGRSYRATRDLATGTCVLDIHTPYACTIYKRFRNEVCAQCWRYECGRRSFLTSREWGESAGLLFCDDRCKESWLEQEGEDMVYLLQTLEGARNRRQKKNEDEECINTEKRTLLPQEIEQAWVDVQQQECQPKVVKRWKNIQLSDYEADLGRFVLTALAHCAREAKSSTSNCTDAHSPRQEGFGANWSDFAALQSGEMEIMQRFPELLDSHIRIYQALRSRFGPMGNGTECAQLLQTGNHWSDGIPEHVVSGNNVRIALGVDPGNSFGIWESPITDDSEGLGFGVYPTPSFFNHTCFPNVKKERDGRRLRFITTREVVAGEDLCISYGYVDGMEVETRRKELLEGWFFECYCNRCIEELSQLERSTSKIKG